MTASTEKTVDIAYSIHSKDLAIELESNVYNTNLPKESSNQEAVNKLFSHLNTIKKYRCVSVGAFLTAGPDDCVVVVKKVTTV